MSLAKGKYERIIQRFLENLASLDQKLCCLRQHNFDTECAVPYVRCIPHRRGHDVIRLLHKSANEIPEKKTFVQHNEREEEGARQFQPCCSKQETFLPNHRMQQQQHKRKFCTVTIYFWMIACSILFRFWWCFPNT